MRISETTNEDLRVYSSSSGESITDSIISEDSFVKDILEEDGQEEVVLIPHKEVRATVQSFYFDEFHKLF